MIKWEDVKDLTIEGVSSPYDHDMADAYASEGYNLAEKRPLTDAELDYVNDNYAEQVQEYARERCFED